MYVLDSNIIIRVITRDHPIQSESARKLLLHLKEKNISFIIPGIVISEVVWTLKSHYEYPKPLIIKSLKAFLDSKNLSIIDDYNYQTALILFSNHNIKFIDCLIASLPQLIDQKFTLVTYDQDFTQLPILTTTPENILK